MRLRFPLPDLVSAAVLLLFVSVMPEGRGTPVFVFLGGMLIVLVGVMAMAPRYRAGVSYSYLFLKQHRESKRYDIKRQMKDIKRKEILADIARGLRIAAQGMLLIVWSLLTLGVVL